MIELTTRSEAETIAVARRLAERLRPGDVVALEGPLGAGKTCFVRGLAEGLGLDPRLVSSPTFVLCQEYEPRAGAAASRALTLVHVDAYRLSSPDELETIGWDEILRAGDAVLAVEWPERLGAELPADHVRVQLSHAGPSSRVIVVDAPDALIGGLAAGGHSGARHRCPICDRPVDAEGEAFPFCSARCRLVDLGKWLGGGYRVSRPLLGEDELS